MKKTKIYLVDDAVIDGKKIGGGEVIATLDACCDAGTIASLIRAQAVALEVEGSEEPEPEVEPEDDDDAEIDTELEPVADEQPEAEPEAENELADLMAAGLDENLAERLAVNGFKTADEVRDWIAAGNDLVDLEKIGDGYAKKILKALAIK